MVAGTFLRAFSSAGLEHLPYKQRVGGSNPDLYINAVLKRDALFQIVGSDSKENNLLDEEVSSDTTPATDFVLVGYLCSGLALLFLLSGINLCFFFVAPNRAVLPALSRLGLSDSFCLLADFSAAVICQWLIFSDRKSVV